jgi:hypothetical protein
MLSDPWSKWASRLALSLTSLFCLIPSIAWWNGIPPLGDDASSHIVLYARIAEALSTGAGWWAPDFNLGFPIGIYYQPLPHFVGGVTTALLGGGDAAIGVYKGISIGLTMLFPWAVAFGALRMGLGRVAATVAGIAAPMIVSDLGFGLTIRSNLILALHTQAWAAVVLPIALGEIARALDGKRRAFPTAIAAWSLLCLCHFFYGIATAAVIVAWIALRPRSIPIRTVRAVGIGLGVGLTLTFWLVPLLATLPAMGGWPFGSDYRVDGYGFSAFLGPLVHGDVLDAGAGMPTLTALAGLGFAVCLYRALRPGAERLVLAATVLCALLTIGRAGLGPIVDLLPINRAVQMFRYLGLFHLCCLWLIGCLAGEVVRHVRDPVAAILGVVLLGVVLHWPALNAQSELAIAFRNVDDADLDRDEYARLVEGLRHEAESTGSGRVFVHRRSGLFGHFHSALLGLWGPNDVGESYGVGLHDSLNFYYLEFFHPERENDDVLLDLYGFQYIVGSPTRNFEFVGAESVLRSRDYELWRLDHRVAICQPIDSHQVWRGSPRSLREQARQWLNGNGPEAGVHPLAELPTGLNLGGFTRAPVTVDAVTNVPQQATLPGRLLLDQRAPDRHLCRVDMARSGAVLFKVSYHPFWEATVDGVPVDTTYAFPAFVAVELPPGRHEIAIRYRLPRYVFPLLCLGLLPTFIAWGWSLRTT